MQQNVMPIPEERIEAITGNELAAALAQLSGRTVEEIKNHGVLEWPHAVIAPENVFGGTECHPE